jgi:hypothetical protein
MAARGQILLEARGDDVTDQIESALVMGAKCS